MLVLTYLIVRGKAEGIRGGIAGDIVFKKKGYSRHSADYHITRVSPAFSPLCARVSVDESKTSNSLEEIQKTLKRNKRKTYSTLLPL